MIAESECFRLLVERHAYRHIAQLALEVATIGQRLQLLGSIDGVRDHLAQKDFMITVEKLFDNGEYVLGCNPDVSFLHSFQSLLLFFLNIPISL